MRMLDLILAFGFSATTAYGQAGPIEDFNGVLVPAGTHSPELVFWRKVPTSAQIKRVFPKDLKYRASTQWKCSVSSDGRLSDCLLQAQKPRDDARYALAARKLLPIFRVDPQTIELARGEGKKLLFYVPVYRAGSKPLIDNECQPPFCVPVLPPPRS